ncbi:MFS transporter [Elusimicrobiota bacterium]
MAVPKPTDKSSLSTQRAVLTITILASFIDPFLGSSVNVALPTIGRDFAMSAVLMGWVNTAFLLAAATFSIPFGRLGDIYGRKRIYMTGVIILMIASALIPISNSSGTFISLRVLQGFGMSMSFATRLAMLMSVFPANQRGRVLGINVTAVYLGLSAGPFLGGIITQHLGWRFLFWIYIPIGIIMLILIFLLIKGDWTDDKTHKFDLTGSIIFGVSLASMMYGFSRLPQPHAAVMTVFGILGIIGFICYESRVKEPVVDIGMFRNNTTFAFSNLAAIINYAATFAVSFIMSIYLQKVRGFSPQTAGLIMVSQPIVMAIFSPFAGRLSDRIQPRTVASVGMAMALIGLILLFFISTTTPLSYIIGCFAFLGLGFALFSSPNTNAIMSSVERRYYGVAGATVGTMRQIGMMFSMGIIMMILALHLGQAQVEPENIDAFMNSAKTGFAVFAALCFAGIFASLARGKIQR